MGRYAIEARRVALCLMDAILQNLGLFQAYLRTKLDQGMQLIAFNSYPQSTRSQYRTGPAF